MLKVIHLSHTIWYKCYCFITQQSLFFSLSQVFTVFVSISWKLINHIFAFDSDNNSVAFFHSNDDNSVDSDSVAFHSDDDEQRQSVETTKLWWKVNWFNLPYWLNEKLFQINVEEKKQNTQFCWFYSTNNFLFYLKFNFSDQTLIFLFLSPPKQPNYRNMHFGICILCNRYENHPISTM